MTWPRFAPSEKASLPVGALVCNPTTSCLWIALFLLFILIQMLTSLVAFAGVFVSSSETLISPFCFRTMHQHGRLSCDDFSVAEPELQNGVLLTVTILGLYIPVVLVAFAMLSLLLAAYSKDSVALRLSAYCQATSCLFVAAGITIFLLLYRAYVSWGDMTLAFYLYVGLAPQLAIACFLTNKSQWRLTSDWE